MALRDRAAFFPTAEPVLERALLLVKPGYESSAAGNVYAEVSRLLEEHDFNVLAKEMKLLDAEAAKVVSSPVDESKEEAEYLASDMSIVLVVEKVGAIQELQLLIGPNSVDEARQFAPHTLRARFGPSGAEAQAFRNLVYASESSARAESDLGLFFPAALATERTLVLLKPEVVLANLQGQVLDVLRVQGFTVQAQENLYLSRARAELFLSNGAGAGGQGRGQGSFDTEAAHLSSGPCLALVVSKVAGVSSLLRLLGPTDPVQARAEKPLSLRAKLGGVDAVHNGLYGSLSKEQAQKDLDDFFPGLPRQDLPATIGAITDLLSSKGASLEASYGAPHRAQVPGGTPEQSVYEVLVKGLTQLCRVKPTGDDAVLYLSDWLLANNPNKPRMDAPVDVAPVLNLAEELESASASSPSAAAGGAGGAVVPETLGITWLVGAPGTNKTGLAARAVKELSGAGVAVEHISVSALLRGAVQARDSTHAQMVSEYVSSGRVVPPHVLTSLLVQAVRSSPCRRVLISAFPLSLDQSFELEKAVGSQATKQLVFLECAKAQEGSLAARALAANPALDPQNFARRLKAFNEDIQPVIEHYDLFQKVKRINAGLEEEEEVLKSLKKLLAK